MARDLFNRYVWLVDTIKRYGRITRKDLDECWRRSPFSNGEGLARRTFYNYRMAVEELFSINIECDTSTFEYYIAQEDAHNESVTNWLLNSAATNDVLTASRDVSDRIFLEDVPSARNYLGLAIDALKHRHPICFTYNSYTRSQPTRGVTLEPYFLKIFKQRWYVTGRNAADLKIKTYALDRMQDVTISTDTFAEPAGFDVETYSRDSFGIVFTQSEVRMVELRTDPHQAKYFRDLPLHRSQQEIVHDNYSIFTYHLRLTPDLVSEILSHGSRVTVLNPPELKAMVRQELEGALSGYSN